MLQVIGAALKQVEKLKYLGVAFTIDGRKDKELDTRIGKASAGMRALHYSVVMKRELSKKVKLSIFKAVIVPILAYGHESWVMTKSVRSQVQASERGFYKDSKELHSSTRCVALRFENLLTSSRYFSEIYFSLEILLSRFFDRPVKLVETTVKFSFLAAKRHLSNNRNIHIQIFSYIFIIYIDILYRYTVYFHYLFVKQLLIKNSTNKPRLLKTLVEWFQVVPNML